MQHATIHTESLRRRRRPTTRLAALSGMTAMTLSVLLLTGCSNGASPDTSAQSLAGGTSSQDQVRAKASAKFSPTDASAKPAEAAKSGGSQVGPVGSGQKLTKTATLDLQVRNIEVAAARVRAIAVGLQAQILSEQLGKGDPGGPPVPLQDGKDGQGVVGSSASGSDAAGFGTLTLSVPADKLDAALDQLAKGETVLRRNTSSQDVTSQFVDTASRLKTMRASVERVRALLSKARDLGQVVTLEGELSQREADLESLESQLNALKDSVARSPLTVSLSTPGNEPVVRTGFAGGLRSGWDAFTASAGKLLTGIGAALPFILFFALVGAPVLWLLRRRLHLPVRSTGEASSAA